MNRRSFLGYSAAALAAPSDAVWRNRQSGMAYRRLGRTNFMVSEFVFGTLPARPDKYEEMEVAIDLGLNYLDTAAEYAKGLSEQAVAKVIAGSKRDRVFLNTKASPFRANRNKLFKDIFDSLPAPEQKKLRSEAQEALERRQAENPDYLCNYFGGQQQALEDSALSNVMEKRYGRRIDRKANYRDLVIRSIDESLARLKTDHLDLMMCPHGANTYEEVTQFPEIFEAFETLKKQGKVKHLGVSAHSDPAGVLEGAIDAKVYSVAQIAYNVINHKYVDKALDKAAKADFGVIAMKAARPVYPNRPRSENKVAPEWLDRLNQAVPGEMKVPLKAYTWVLRDRRISAICSEMLTPDIVRENLALAGKKA